MARFAARGRRTRTPLPPLPRGGSRAPVGTGAIVGGSRARVAGTVPRPRSGPTQRIMNALRRAVESDPGVPQLRQGQYHWAGLSGEEATAAYKIYSDELSPKLRQQGGEGLPGLLAQLRPVVGEALGEDVAQQARETGQSRAQIVAEKYGLSPEEAELTLQLIEQAELEQARPEGGFQLAMRALNLGTNVSAGVVGGTTEELGKEGFGSHLLAPWTYYNALGHGFAEVPGAIKDEYTYGKLIQERTDPDSFLYRYSMPIGLTLDIALDPVTYLSFGTSSVSKLQAGAIWAQTWDEAARVAKKNLDSGAINPRTKQPYKPHEAEIAFHHALLETGAPMTLGDVLIPLREAGLEQKALQRAGKRGTARFERKNLMRQSQGLEPKPLTPFQKAKGVAGGFLAPTAVSGGRGIRFAGLEIPGTPRAGEFLARRSRQRAHNIYGKEGFYAGRADQLIPDSGIRHIVMDGLRANAAWKVMEIRNLQQAGPRVLEDFQHDILSASLRGDRKVEKLVPGKPSTTGPETGKYFNAWGDVDTMAPDEPFWKTHNIYDENDNLIGSVVYGEPRSFYDEATEDLPDYETYVDSVFLRPEFRTWENFEKLITPLRGKRVGGTIVNTQLARVVRKMQERGRLDDIDVSAIQRFDEDLSEIRWNEEEGQWTVETRPRPEGPHIRTKDEMEIEGELPELGTPPTSEEVMERYILGSVGDVLPYKDRLDVHTTAPSKLTREQQELRAMVENRRDIAMTKARERNVKQDRLDILWQTASGEFRDPVSALSRFQTSLQLELDRKLLIDEVLTDPRFSYELGKSRTLPSGVKVMAETPRPGYEVVKRGSKRYAVLSPVKVALDGIRNDAFMRQMMDQATFQLTDIQDWWKIYATLPNPSFHTMNFLGAVWNNMLMGVYNPLDYVDAFATLHQSRLAGMARRGEKRMFTRRVPELTPEREGAERLVRAAEERRGLGRQSFFMAETEKHLSPEFPSLAKPQGVRRLWEVPPELEAKGAGSKYRTPGRRFAYRRARQVGAVAGAVPTGGLSLLGLAPEAARVGRKVGGNIEDLVRMTPFMKEAHNPQVIQALEAFGPPRIPGLTHPGFTKAQQRRMYDLGAAMTRHFQFDYTDLTHFERYFAKSIFPFYTYYRKNFVLQARELVKQPRQFVTTDKVMNYIEQQNEDLGPMEAVLPKYFETLTAFQVPVPNSVREQLGLPRDTPLYLNPKLPFASLNLFPPLWQIAGDPYTPTPQRAGAILAPIFGSVGPHAFGIPGSKVVLEYVIGHQLGLNRPLDYQRSSSGDYRNSYRPIPFYAKYLPDPIRHVLGIVKNKRGEDMMPASNLYLLEQSVTPFITNAASIVPAEGATESQKGKAKADLVSWLFGIRLMPADLHRLSAGQAYMVKNYYEARKSELREQGLELSEEEEDLLELAKDAIEVAREVDELRDEEQYGDE